MHNHDPQGRGKRQRARLPARNGTLPKISQFQANVPPEDPDFYAPSAYAPVPYSHPLGFEVGRYLPMKTTPQKTPAFHTLGAIVRTIIANEYLSTYTLAGVGRTSPVRVRLANANAPLRVNTRLGYETLPSEMDYGGWTAAEVRAGETTRNR